MVTETRPPITKKRPKKNGNAAPTHTGSAHAPNGFRTNSDHWPQDIEEAYRRYPGPYTAANAETVISEEPLEIFNGWLVWEAMTDQEERRAAANIQEILSFAARLLGFGQAYPDQCECVMANGDLYKPDVCLISTERYESKVGPVAPGREHLVLRGSPELIVESRSPSNRRTKERRKRRIYFENGALVIWGVDSKKRKIWVYEAADPEKPVEYSGDAEISCEGLLPGWRRKVSDFFTKDLSAEQVAGQAAVQWRAEGKAEGREEGLAEGKAEGREEGELAALRASLERQARRRYGEGQLPPDLAARLEPYNVNRLTELEESLAASRTIEEWLESFRA
jgi:Uma2 family endonuclease